MTICRLNVNSRATRNYRNITSLLVVMTWVIATTAQSAPINAPQVPTSVGNSYYHLGGGRVLPPPGAGATTFNISARFQIGLGYSCGKFNFQDNIRQMVNQFQTQVRQIPGQLQTAASAAVAALPGYLLQKVNPTLYNVLTKTLDETANLFNLSYKSCQQIEQEMQQNPNANPYQGFMKASVADRWTLGQESGELAADIDQSIKDEPREPIKWLGGNLYGTASNPIQVNRDIVVAGYNIMIGRTGDVSITTAPGAAMANDPIVRIWSTPAEAGTWAQEVLGDLKIVLNDSTTPPDSVAGKGLRPKVEQLETAIDAALKTALQQDDYQSLNTYASVRVSAAIIDSLRSMPIGESAVMADRLVSELAVNEARERLMLIKQMMMTGLRAPDLISSTGGSVAQEHIRGATFQDMDRVIAEIVDTLEVKQKTLNKTTIAIINHAASQKKQATRGLATPVTGGPNALSGGVAP